MDRPPIRVGLSEDQSRATLKWEGAAELNAHELGLLIEALGTVRSLLTPAVPVAPPPLDARLPELSHIELRKVAIGSEVPAEVGAMFLVRSAAYGWLDCPMAPEFCRNLGLWLLGKGGDISAPTGTILQ